MTTGGKIEVEMKYEVTVPGSADGYLVAPELGPFVPEGHVRSARVEDRYVDSPDWALARAGFAARLRKTSHGTQISLKALNPSVGAVHRREEIEGPANSELIPGDWPPSPARAVVMELCGDESLVESLTVRQLRRVRLLRAPGARVELSLDEVEIVGNGRTLTGFEELEVELKRGHEGPLEALAQILGRDRNLQPMSRSKLDRAAEAMRAVMPAMPAAIQRRWRDAPPELFAVKPKQPGTRAETESSTDGDVTRAMPSAASVDVGGDGKGAADVPAVDADASPSGPPSETEPRPKPGPRTLGIVAEDSMPEAARKVLRFHFAKMQRREEGTRAGQDSEELHNMRVATRRMRAAWRIFDGAFKPSKTRKYVRFH
jgi:hypothetical protein